MKEFLSQHGVPWTEKYVDEDRAAAIEMIRRSGQTGVPVTMIGDEVVVGFDRPRLERIVAAMRPRGSGTSSGQASGGRRSLGAKVADAGRFALPGGTPVPGAYVGGVNPGSPAEAAGLGPGDVIVAVDNTPVRSADDLALAIRQSSQDNLTLTVARGKNTRQVRVNLGQQ